MRFTRTVLAIAGVASLAANAQTHVQAQAQEQVQVQVQVQVQQLEQNASTHHLPSSASSPAHNRHDQHAFQRRIVTKRTQQQPHRRQKQNYQTNNQANDYPAEADQQGWASQSLTDPIGASQAVLSQNVMVFNNQNFSASLHSINNDQETQLPKWQPYNLSFTPIGDAPAATAAGGWPAIPVQPGFDLVNWTIVGNAIMPYYVTSGYNPALIKRAVLTWPGKPRDCWKYGAYALSALQAAHQKSILENLAPEDTPANDSVLIISPQFLNDADLEAGSVESNWISFHGSRWQSGYPAKTPAAMNDSITSYDIMDNFTDWLFDKTRFPNLNSVSIIGHSMGGQAAQRYAVLKKTKPYDDNIRYWIGNPGSWAWLNPDRPSNTNESCSTTTYDEWGYGLAGNLSKMTKYGRKQVNASKTDVVNRFLGRRVHIALALLDNGPGDTHCEALAQGDTHLGRGSQFVQDIADVTNGVWPSKFSLAYVPDTSHADFNMFSADQSLYHIFQEDFNVRYPDLTKVLNPGDVAKKPPGTKSFATPTHKIMAYSLLLGSIACIILAFALLPYLFPANSKSWEESAWESEAKRKLI
ncbi:unnamed protein product [Tilletia controversa]|uniref:GPI inositol-deacylase n=3 Tax=Tilletia TaxID=13289 RepID=A0A8X7MMQ7_9BASI|nr:hypothetical protein CF336_g7344 [Tilletia laevis]KAE8187384.1 hypothetical protein CF328_g6933 [Tilletia controversa]KAE8241149.1 hypothetical protein A4X03_0g8205 [Tilletia caries]KAE8190579.1 hypothetical protein CF335_g6320 [Tilletia laevis]KAE8241179.1 hypothetical protein A4X06_0g7635 [Tilletia controversa]